jgi:hypothetical protein
MRSGNEVPIFSVTHSQLNGSNADKAPKSNAMIVQLATHLSRGLCAISGSRLSTIFDYRTHRISAAIN